MRVELLTNAHEQLMQSGRMERRTAISVVARLESAAESWSGETAFLENISTRGARVIANRRWDTYDRLQLSSPAYGFRSTAARVVYCERLRNGQFALGVAFDLPIVESMIGALVKIDRS